MFSSVFSFCHVWNLSESIIPPSIIDKRVWNVCLLKSTQNACLNHLFIALRCSSFVHYVFWTIDKHAGVSSLEYCFFHLCLLHWCRFYTSCDLKLLDFIKAKCVRYANLWSICIKHEKSQNRCALGWMSQILSYKQTAILISPLCTVPLRKEKVHL